MAKTLNTNAYLEQVLSMLQTGASDVPVPISGTSMAPFLHPGDRVYLNLPTREYRIGDVVLFSRPDGHYVLHRIVQKKQGHYLLQGDAQLYEEIVPADRLLALVTGVQRGENRRTGHLTLWFYRCPWRWLRHLRGFFAKLHQALHCK